ncbi:MAG: GatB/YqeY domain-containing protein [Alphaproteobacteria bacterium]|nr:GatB/YqeY domain-containing protein [Alphaproteobacteria bacterium]
MADETAQNIPDENMRARINNALKDSIKSGQKRRISTLRLINAAIKDRDIAARGADKMEGVTDDEILEILSKMVKQRVEAAKTYEEAGRAELAEQEREEIQIIHDFLPRQLDKAELQAAVEGVITTLGATSLKDMGKVMGELKSRYAGQMDFGEAGALVKKQLG